MFLINITTIIVSFTFRAYNLSKNLYKNLIISQKQVELKKSEELLSNGSRLTESEIEILNKRMDKLEENEVMYDE